MTGHNNYNPNQSEMPSFLTTLQDTLDILDDISSVMEENTYLTLTNNLQQLYNIHTSSSLLIPSSIIRSIIIPSITTSSNNRDYFSNYDISNNANNNSGNNNSGNNNSANNNSGNNNSANNNSANNNSANYNSANNINTINSLSEIPIPLTHPMFGDYISNTRLT